MNSHRARVSAALGLALLVAAVLQFLLIHLAALNAFGGSATTVLFQTVVQTFGYGLLLGVPAVIAIELLRLRRLNIQLVIGTVLTFVAAHLAARYEPMTSFVFSGGALTPLAVLVSGLAASVTYWMIAGRHAGWRGDDIEREYERIVEAYRRCSDKAKAERCRPCLLIWAGASTTAFAVFAWLMIDAAGLGSRLLLSSKHEGQLALTASGFTWATFNIAESRGTIEGHAPNELEKRMAYDTAREALNSVTGFPGVLSRIDDKSIAQIPMDVLNQKLADAERREQQAKDAIDEARRLAEAARAAGAGAMVKPAGKVMVAADMAQTQTSEQQTLIPETQDAELPHRAAEQLAKSFDTGTPNTGSPSAETPNSETPSSSPQEDIVAAVSAEAPSAEAVGASQPPKPLPHGAACTEQDVAMVESSRVLFAPQTFVIPTRHQRELDLVAAAVQVCAARPLLVTGHSDASADSLFNPALGLQRAEAVRDGLIARGISATKIAIKSTSSAPFGNTLAFAAERIDVRKADFKFLEELELSRDATQRPDERASNCETDLSGIMSQSVIHFPIASARISEESLGLISKLAGAIQTCGSVIVTVEGHTDKIGTPERNQQLSVVRANAVREALVAAGADLTRLASRGFASTRPFATEDTAEAFALNRRIEFKVSGKFTSTNAGGP